MGIKIYGVALSVGATFFAGSVWSNGTTLMFVAIVPLWLFAVFIGFGCVGFPPAKKALDWLGL